MKKLRVDANRALLVGLSMVIDDLLVDADDVLTFVIVDQVEGSKGWDDVVFLDTRYFANLTKIQIKINKKIRLTA